MFVVVAAVGASLGWLATQFKWKHDRELALRWITPIGARQTTMQNGSAIPQDNGIYVSLVGSTVPWTLKMLGELGVERIEVSQDSLSTDGAYSVDELRVLFPEAEVMVAIERKPRQLSPRDRLPNGEYLIRGPLP